MRSKKTFSIILSGLIIFGVSFPVYAQGVSMKSTSSSYAITVNDTISENNSKISKDEAKDIAKKALSDYFEIIIDDTQYQTNVNFRPNYNQLGNTKDYVWDIFWSYNHEDKNVNISISVDSNTGKVLNAYNRSYSNGKTSGIAILTEDKAKVIGEKFLNKINSKEFSQCKLASNEDNIMYKGDATTYNFNYFRVVNGISFKGNMLTVSVDGITGKVNSYSINWNDSEVPAISTDIISKEKANKIFKDNINLQPKYIDARDPYAKGSDAPTLKLSYVLDITSATNIDAKAGKMIAYDNGQVVEKKNKDLDSTQRKVFFDSYKPLQKFNKELDSKAAEVIMKNLVSGIYGDGYDIESINYQDSNNGMGSNVSNWSGQFYKKDSKNRFQDQGNISIDALTGQLQSVNKYNPYGGSTTGEADVKAKLTWEQSYDKAIEIIKNYLPDKVKDIATGQEYTRPLEYYNTNIGGYESYNFNFNRLLNGIAYQNNFINVTIDPKTGEVQQVYNSWTQNLKGISSDGIMSLEDAKNIFFKKYIPELSYTVVNTSKDSTKPILEVKLVYSIQGGAQYSQFNNIEAFTGKFLDYNGQEIDNNIAAFKEKIKGSPVENELSILASQGIIATKDFELNKQITRTNLIKMLVNVKGYMPYLATTNSSLKMMYSGARGDETYKYLQNAVSYGILDDSGEFKGDENITREEMIKDIVRLLGYRTLAEAKGIFVVSYSDASDITADNLGYVAISKGLALTNDLDNKFNPRSQVTMSDAAVSIYKALDSLRNTR